MMPGDIYKSSQQDLCTGITILILKYTKLIVYCLLVGLGIRGVSSTHPSASSRLCFQIAQQRRLEKCKLGQQDYARRLFHARTTILVKQLQMGFAIEWQLKHIIMDICNLCKHFDYVCISKVPWSMVKTAQDAIKVIFFFLYNLCRFSSLFLEIRFRNVSSVRQILLDLYLQIYDHRLSICSFWFFVLNCTFWCDFFFFFYLLDL